MWHYKGIIWSGSFNVATISEHIILTILRNTKVTKAAGLDNLSAALEIESKEPQQNFCCHKLLFIAV